jgi:omega-6 fatty acid desaturase (delta-12 desaturase)
LLNSFVPYVLLWAAMVYALMVSYWLMLPLAILAAGFLARIFIIFHDCGHGSFFQSKRANRAIGAVAGLRLARNPMVLFGIAPVYVFVVHNRFASAAAPPRERQSVRRTNMALLTVTVLMSVVMGLRAFLLIQLTVTAFAGAVGVWLFYVQHQFEGVHWARSKEWDHTRAALQGSSYYKLPKILQWFTGNIGFHHIHHLSPRIANYHLERCHDADPYFKRIKPVTLLGSFKSLTYRLWDEQRQRFVGFRHLRAGSMLK